MLNLTQSNYITTQIQLPLYLEVIFKAEDKSSLSITWLKTLILINSF